MTTKGIMREERGLGKEEMILPYKNRSIVGHLGVVYIFSEVVYSLEALYLRYQYKRRMVFSCMVLTKVCDICS